MAESKTLLQLLRERWLSVMLGATLMPAIQGIITLVWIYLFQWLPLRAIVAAFILSPMVVGVPTIALLFYRNLKGIIYSRHR
jgi:hypothetical protein